MQTMAQQLEKIKAQLDMMNKQAERRGFLCPIDTETVPTDKMPPALLELMFTPWSEIEASEEKKRMVKELIGES